MTKYFDDQPKVPGADVIYRPAREAGEYAPLATNPYKGCGHACKYCYVPNATHIDRKLFNAGAVPREGFVERLQRDVARYRAAGICDGHPADQIFITFSSDPFHPGDTTPTTKTITELVLGGMSFCTLSKGGLRALPFADFYRPHRDAFAVTLTTVDNDEFSQMWEPGAALPGERIETLKEFKRRGIFTWASLEPTLNAEESLRIVRETHEFVDLYKIGRANYVPTVIKETDWRDYTLRIVELCQKVGARHYIKRSLQAHLPEGYPNPLRVPQHN